MSDAHDGIEGIDFGGVIEYQVYKDHDGSNWPFVVVVITEHADPNQYCRFKHQNQARFVAEMMNMLKDTCRMGLTIGDIKAIARVSAAAIQGEKE